VLAIHEVSQGIPRTINVVCDNALIGGLAAQVKPVSAEIVEQVSRDFDLRPPSAETPAAIAAPPLPGPGRLALESGIAPRQTDGTTEPERPLFGTAVVPQKRRFSFFS